MQHSKDITPPPPAEVITWIIRWQLFYAMARASLSKFHVMTAKIILQSFFYAIAYLCFTHNKGFPNEISWRAMDYMSTMQ